MTIETGRSFSNIRELRGEISQLNRVVETGTKLVADESGQLVEVAVSAEEYDQAVRQLAEDKRTLNDVTNLNRNAWNKEADAVDRSAKSYQQLQAEMRRLRVAWRNTADADDRKKIAVEINDINDRLKAMDAETGNYQRNVGDYLNSIKAGLAGIPGPAGKAVGSLNGVSASLKAVAANPATAALAALSLAVVGVTKVFKDFDERLKNNEDLQLQWMEATEGARAIVDAYNAKLDEMGGEYAQLRAEMEETKAKAEVFFRSLFLHLDEASNVGRWMPIVGLFKQIRAAWKDMDAAADEASDYRDKESAITEAYKSYLTTYRDSVKKQAEIEKTIADANLISADSERSPQERLDAVNLSIAKTNELFDEQVRVLLARKEQLEAEANTGENSIEVNNQLAETEAELTRLGSDREMQLRRLIALRARLNKETNAAAKAVADDQQALLDSFNDEEEIAAYDAEMAARAKEQFQRATELRGQIIDEQVADIVGAAYAQIAAMDLVAKKDAELLKQEEEAAARRKEFNEARKQSYFSYADAVSSVLGSIADIMDETTDREEGAAKGSKTLRIASAIIDTLSGAVSAYMQAQTLPPAIGIPVGIANAATVTAMGMANVAKIRSTNVSKSGSAPSPGASSIVLPPAVVQEVPVTRTLTGASEEERANQQPPIKVALVMSELEAKQAEVTARTVETTF